MIESIYIDFGVEEIHIELDNGDAPIIVGFEELRGTVTALLAAQSAINIIEKEHN